MSYHILSINTANCTITCAHKQLVFIDAEGATKTLPIEDIGAMVISSFNAKLSSNFLIEAAKQKIGLILCELHKPACILLPIDRASDTDILVKLANLKAQFKERLWQKTVQAKCENQFHLAQQWNPAHPALSSFQTLIDSTSTYKEAECAKLFWKIFADTHLPDQKFTRNRNEDGANALFNYGYAVLLSCILQKLLALGIDPTFGIFHRPREHATPLAYDLMEPFRPCFDANITRWISLPSSDDHPGVSDPCRRHIVMTLQAVVQHNGKEYELQEVIETVCRSFRKTLSSQTIAPYQPWKISTIKWAGSS